MDISCFDLHGEGSPGLSQAVRADQLVVLSGQAAVDQDGRVVGDDVATQAAYCFDNIDALLRRAGSDPAHVLRITTYLTDASQYGAYNDAKRRWLGDAAPAGTVVVVADLLIPGLLLEIEVLAAVRSGSVDAPPGDLRSS